jgi:hypothetical protein
MPCTLGLSPTSQWGSSHCMYIKTNRAPHLATALRLRRGLLTTTLGLLPLYMYKNKQSSAPGYRTALAQGIAHPDVGSPHLFPRGQWNSYLHWESFSSMSTGCPHLKRARWSSLRPGVFLLWYVSFSNFQLALVVSDKVEFLPGSCSLLCVQRRHIHAFVSRLARSS